MALIILTQLYGHKKGSLPGVKSGRRVTLTPHPLIVPWLIKSRAIPLFPLRVLRPVQSLSACTRVHFTFTFTDRKTVNFCPEKNHIRSGR